MTGTRRDSGRPIRPIDKHLLEVAVAIGALLVAVVTLQIHYGIHLPWSVGEPLLLSAVKTILVVAMAYFLGLAIGTHIVEREYRQAGETGDDEHDNQI